MWTHEFFDLSSDARSCRERSRECRHSCKSAHTDTGRKFPPIKDCKHIVMALAKNGKPIDSENLTLQRRRRSRQSRSRRFFRLLFRGLPSATVELWGLLNFFYIYKININVLIWRSDFLWTWARIVNLSGASSRLSRVCFHLFTDAVSVRLRCASNSKCSCVIVYFSREYKDHDAAAQGRAVASTVSVGAWQWGAAGV